MKMLFALLALSGTLTACLAPPTVKEEGDITQTDLKKAACLGSQKNEDNTYTPRKIEQLDSNMRILYEDCMKKI